MAFDWNLDDQAAEDSTPDYRGFEPLGLSQDPVTTAAPVVPPTFTTAAPVAPRAAHGRPAEEAEPPRSKARPVGAPGAESVGCRAAAVG